MLPVGEQVSRKRVAERRLVLHRKAVRVRQFREATVVVFLDQLAEQTAPVAQKTFRFGRRTDHPAEDGRQMAHGEIAAPCSKGRVQPVRPVVAIAFPAVHDHAVEQPLQRPFREPSDIRGVVRLDSARRKLRAFPARRLFGRGAVSVKPIDVPKTQDGPRLLVGRHPVQRAVRTHPPGQVDDRLRGYPAFRILLRRGAVNESANRPARKPLPVFHSRGRGKAHVAEADGIFRPERQPPAARRRLVARERLAHAARSVVLPVSGRQGFAHDCPPDARRRLGLEDNRRLGVVGAVVVQLGRRGDLQRPHGHGFVKGEEAHLLRRREDVSRRQPAGRVALRRRERQHEEVAVVARRMIRRLRRRRQSHGRAAPHIRP